MGHPLGRLTPHARAWALFVLLLSAGVVSVCLSAVGQPLVTAEAPRGMASFELAFKPAKSAAIMRSWGDAREVARTSLWLDYAFIPLYSTALALLCVLSAGSFHRRGWRGLGTLATLLAWGQWLAALLDGVENGALLRLLQEWPTVPASLPLLAGCCAAAKFFLIDLGLVCVGVAVACSLGEGHGGRPDGVGGPSLPAE